VSDIDSYIQTSAYFLTFDNSIRFFTCYSYPALSFHFYVSSFQLQVWIAIILSGMLIATFLKCYIYYNISKTLNFSTAMFYFSIFMEESYSIPSKIGKNKVYRTATILWLLTAVVLTNTYISHVTSGLNAPLTGEKLGYNELYENSSDEPTVELVNFIHTLVDLQLGFTHFFSRYLNSKLETLHREQTSASGYSIMSEPLRLSYPEDIWLHLKNPFIFSAFCFRLSGVLLIKFHLTPPYVAH